VSAVINYVFLSCSQILSATYRAPTACRDGRLPYRS